MGELDSNRPCHLLRPPRRHKRKEMTGPMRAPNLQPSRRSGGGCEPLERKEKGGEKKYKTRKERGEGTRLRSEREESWA